VKVLLTGASGFIGARVARALVARGHEVTAVFLPQDRLDRLKGLSVNLSPCDLHDAETVKRILGEKRPEGCIHLAWYAVPGLYLHSDENLNSLSASTALLQHLLAAGCRNVVMAGSCAEYDTGAAPLLRENGPTKPATLYAACKLAMSLIGEQLATKAEARFAWGRVFYPYGPGEDPRRAIPSLIRTLLEGKTFDASAGEQIRDYVHVDDVASGFVQLLEREAHGVFNISSAAPRTMKEIMQTAGRALGKEAGIRFGAVPYRGWEPPRICGDNAKLKALGWSPRFELESGIRDAIEWWRQHPTS
jgi:nucleoside-diphosphate-sugar epimerase